MVKELSCMLDVTETLDAIEVVRLEGLALVFRKFAKHIAFRHLVFHGMAVADRVGFHTHLTSCLNLSVNKGPGPYRRPRAFFGRGAAEAANDPARTRRSACTFLPWQPGQRVWPGGGCGL